MLCPETWQAMSPNTIAGAGDLLRSGAVKVNHKYAFEEE
jgi:hypothetical protein